jgi:ribose transport system ATP-binding protein
MKVLMGIEQPDGGSINLRGNLVSFANPSQAFNHGIGMVFQEEACLSNMRVYENVFLGREDKFLNAGMLNRNQMMRESRDILKEVGTEIDPNEMVANLSLPERQMVEIARALVATKYTQEQAIIILDESTSMLSVKEVEQLFERLKPLRELAAFILISHRLEEILQFTNRIVIMKDGLIVGERLTSNTSIGELQELMVGREMVQDYYCEEDQIEPSDDFVLNVEDIYSKGVHGVSFHLRKGEILGMAGLIGCGRREVIRAIYGDLPLKSGKISYNGRLLGDDIGLSVDMGLGYIPADRRGEGIIGKLSVLINLTVATLDQFINMGIINKNREREEAKEFIDRLGVKTPSPDTPMENLSGGNQQKIVLGRWLLGESKILLMNEPTRGIDVGAKQEVYKMIRKLAEEGRSIILVSDELQELIGLSNRILIFRDGYLTKEIMNARNNKSTENDIIKHM